jgi:ferredoxin
MKGRYVFTFPTSAINQPLIYNLIKNYDLKINIFNAYINSEEVGNLALEMEGTEEQKNAGLNYAKSVGVEYTTLDKKISWNSNNCIDCGACTAVCYPGALVISKETLSLVFNHNKCTVCELCTTACPFGLYKIDFVE